jgi:diguanylate cyclase (GGDEF)-like protein/PAS domain S-box-containing protein
MGGASRRRGGFERRLLGMPSLQPVATAAETHHMDLWLPQLALPVRAWIPLGIAALAPLVLAAIIPFSRRRGRGIATALTLRTVVVLSVGFGVLASIATFAVAHAGLRELNQRHAADVRGFAAQLEAAPLGLSAGDAQLKLTIFGAKASDIAFVVAGADACRALCRMAFNEKRFDPRTLKERLVRSWTTNPTDRVTVSIDDRQYLLIGSPIRDVMNKPQTGVVVGVDAEYLADQAARTAWLLLGISYTLLFTVAWTTWKQISRSLATRIATMNTQLRDGVVDNSPHESLEVDGHELRELADNVATYIQRSLDERSASEERHRRLAEMSPDAVLMCADRRIRSANPAAIALTGAKNRADLVASPIEKFLEFIDEKRADGGVGGLRPATWRRLDGKLLYVDVAEVVDKSGNEIVRQFVVRDVTSRREREADLERRAEHDGLTGLVNRGRFEARLHELLDPAANTSSKFGDSREVAVVFIDLDGFKPVNDTYGHAAGDATLVAVAQRLRDSTRGSDLIARLGGDEFAVVLEVRERGELSAVAGRILKSLQQPIPHEGRSLRIGASLGIASTKLVSDIAARPLNAAELVKAADEAMYAAKTSGGHRFVVAGEQSPEDFSDVRFPAVA